MSVQALSWVLEHSPTRLADRLVLISLANHAGSEDRNTYPSVGTLAREARLSERQVQRCLRQLERDGHIESCGKSKYGTIRYDIPRNGDDRLSPPRTGDDKFDVIRSDLSPEPKTTTTTTADRQTVVKGRAAAGGGLVPIGKILRLVTAEQDAA